MNNNVKKEKYAELMQKLKKAINNEYFYEAIFLEYAILEDRTESLLKHAQINIYSNIEKQFKFKLNEKLNKIKSRKEFQDKYIKKHISNDFIIQIVEWKRDRDRIMHDIISLQYKDEKIRRIALDGEKIIKKLNSKTTLIKNHFMKKMEAKNEKEK